MFSIWHFSSQFGGLILSSCFQLKNTDLVLDARVALHFKTLSNLSEILSFLKDLRVCFVSTGCCCVQNSPDLMKWMSVIQRSQQPLTQQCVPDLLTPEVAVRSNSRLPSLVNYSGMWGSRKPRSNIPERASLGIWQNLLASSALRVRLII